HNHFAAHFAVRHGWRLDRSGLPPTLCFASFGLIRVLGDEAHRSNRVCLVAELSGMAGLATLPAGDLRQRLAPHGDMARFTTEVALQHLLLQSLLRLRGFQRHKLLLRLAFPLMFLWLVLFTA